MKDGQVNLIYVMSEVAPNREARSVAMMHAMAHSCSIVITAEEHQAYEEARLLESRAEPIQLTLSMRKENIRQFIPEEVQGHRKNKKAKHGKRYHK